MGVPRIIHQEVSKSTGIYVEEMLTLFFLPICLFLVVLEKENRFLSS